MRHEDIISKALEAGMSHFSYFVTTAHVSDLDRFQEICTEEFRQRLAKAIEEMPFGDTASSFATFVRNFK